MYSKGIAFRLNLSILACVFTIFLIVFSYNYIESRRIILENYNSHARALVLAGVKEVESVLHAVEKIPLNLANVIENSNPTDKVIKRMLKSALRNNHEISGVIVAFETFTFNKKTKYFTPACYRSGDTGIVLLDRLDKPWNVYQEDWYKSSLTGEASVWSEPYYDDKNVMTARYSVPFYTNVNGRREITGVVAADIDLSFLKAIVDTGKADITGYRLVISRNGTILAKSSSHEMNDLFENFNLNHDENLRHVKQDIKEGNAGHRSVKKLLGEDNPVLFYESLKSSGWSFGVVLSKKRLMEDITALQKNSLIFIAIGFCIVVLVTITISKTITRPLRLLVQATDEISSGNFNFNLPVRSTKDETGKLTQSFGAMKDALKKYISDLTATTAVKERIESELEIAHDIQINMIPRIFPPFPDRRDVDLYAMIKPAREVGGDFFDFFFVDEDHLFFYIADVAGKGVPASLFMAVSRTLIKIKCSGGLQPETIMSSVNNDLCVDNESCMFVTAFCGMLNVVTGSLAYVNCGHNPPLLCRSGEHFQFLDVFRDIALGVMPGVSFRSKTTKISEGDTIFIYTDGVNEALNPRKEMFGTERLQQTLNKTKFGTASDIIRHVYATIEIFTEGEEQSDDITMLALTYHGKKGVSAIAT